MTKADENERMAVLETNMKNLDEKVTAIQVDIKSIMLTLSTQASLKTEIENLKRQIADLRKSSNLWKWLAPTLTGIVAALFGSVLTFLIINYLQNL